VATVPYDLCGQPDPLEPVRFFLHSVDEPVIAWPVCALQFFHKVVICLFGDVHIFSSKEFFTNVMRRTTL
jgi:hypothetical protein